MKKLIIPFSFFILMLTYSCKKISNIGIEEGPSPTSSTTANEWDSNPYKLNVVYFVPTDLDTLSNHKNRMGLILADIQEFYAVNMNREGYGRQSFGLDRVNGLLNVVVVRGSREKAYYPSAGGGSKMISEINAYFALHPSEKKSEHCLVFAPKYNPGSTDVVQPFYGTGTFCFVVDYPELGTSVTKAGGIAHELGHALNLPHNGETKSTKATLGTALMGNGVYTYNGQPTFLTAADCAVLSRSQTFSESVRSDWYTTQSIDITNGTTNLSSNILNISGKFNSTMPIEKIVIYHDKKPYGGNLDYDAITFTGTIIGTDSFKVSSPLTDFFNTTDTTQLRLKFIFANGYATEKSLVYTFASNQPVLTNFFPAPISSGINYKLISFVNNSSLLDVTGAGTADNTRAVLWAPITPTPNNQIWKVTAVGNGFYKLEPQHAISKALEVAGASNVNRTAIQIKSYTGGDGQRWKIQPELGGGYSLIPACAPGSRMDIAAGSSANGAQMQLFQANGGNAQKWKFVPQ